MRSATVPPIRLEPEVRAEVEAVLRDGETLTRFIEKAVVAAAAWRRVQSGFVTPDVMVGAVRHQRDEDDRHRSGQARPGRRCATRK
jgi:hypothetical protein